MSLFVCPPPMLKRSASAGNTRADKKEIKMVSNQQNYSFYNDYVQYRNHIGDTGYGNGQGMNFDNSYRQNQQYANDWENRFN